MEVYSLYLHIPFCRHRCGYCDFNTYAGLEDLIAPYVQALCKESEQAGASAAVYTAEQVRVQKDQVFMPVFTPVQAGEAAPGWRLPPVGPRAPVHTIFFGGGTPSLLPPPALERILTTLETAFAWQPGIEISLEANPGTLSLPYLRTLRSLGINRLSLGMQSAHPGELRLLERQHDFPDVVRAVTWARQAGFDNLNLDLIFGLPEQALETWQHTLELALGLNPEHFSLYALTLEHGTPLGHWAGRGLIPEPDPDTAADMYEWASERLEGAGYGQYEISNWARVLPGGGLLACRHNLQYWHNRPYLGLGAGAHGYAGGVRTANVLSPALYIQRLEGGEEANLAFPRTPATASAQAIDQETEIGETMMMGLRLVQEGVSKREFQARFGQRLEEVFGPQIVDLCAKGLLEWAGREGDQLRLTRWGRLLGNQVFMQFI